MQYSALVSLALALAGLSAAAPIANVDKLLVNFDIKKVQLPSSRRGIKAAASGVLLKLANEYSMYIADIEVGTPGQKIRVDIDTGSSDLWVPGTESDSTYGKFDSSKSTTYKKWKSNFGISYGDGSTAKGEWGNDTVTLGGISVTDMTIGNANIKETAGEGVFGIGLTPNEASASLNGFQYPNFPQLLKSQGFIKNIGYSLYLGATDAASGSVLFGAIDHDKYTGDLVELSLDLIDDGGNKVTKPTAFYVDLQSVSDKDSTFTQDTYPALLDSGTTLFYAPSTVAKALGEKYGKYSSNLGGYAVSCNATGSDFDFRFNDELTIKVPFKDMLFKADDSGKQCILGVLANEDDSYILGDVVLRSAYIYYDLEKAKVKMGQVNYSNSTKFALVQ